MAYCSVGNITGSFSRITLDTTSEPTSVEANVFCDEVSIEMDATFQTLGITVPVTSANPLKICRTIALNGSIARVLRSVDMESESAAVFQGLFKQAMKDIIARPEILGTTVTEESPGYQEDRQDRQFSMGNREW